MAHSPPRLLPKGTEKVLMVDPFQPTRDARSRVLRARGIGVATAKDLAEARVLFMPLPLADFHHSVNEQNTSALVMRKYDIGDLVGAVDRAQSARRPF
jgi:hypothetical protein